MYNMECVANIDTLYRSWQKISANKGCPGIDGVDLSLYRSDLWKNLRSLQTSLMCGLYRPYPEKVYQNKNRLISIHCVDDKIVQSTLAETIMTVLIPANSVHGFICKRSIFTAKKTLDDAIRKGVTEFSKIDIRRFYDSIDGHLLHKKISGVFNDKGLLKLFELLINAHEPGISTGSSLSPALSNLYLSDFDFFMEDNSAFYSRYVDDILVSPASNAGLVKEKLSEVGLELNVEKSKEVNTMDGFRYLGFDIKKDIDSAIMNCNYELAEKIYEAQECDLTEDKAPVQANESATESSQNDKYEPPNTIRNVIRKCHIISRLVKKAKSEGYLAMQDKMNLLQVFHCLGEDGANFIHNTLSMCSDYDYAETQRRISRYSPNNPIGCKKLCERAGDDTPCFCNFNNEKLYPTPIIHALRVDNECFKPTPPKDNIGHFKAKNPKEKATDAISAIIELNKNQYEISEQKKILKGQIEYLFERDNNRELITPLGLLIKTDDGIFMKVV
ncbi:MAG: reverse transcriptase/maturase family protein [Synergistaceae bacterium]|nr:reverse transcriptase/maturase family protein [Synergistaceae bacterium]